MSTKKKDDTSSTIALNKKARHDFFIEDRFEAGLVLEGWEVKSLRAGRATLSPLPTASTHIHPDSTRTRKLLLHRDELDKLIGAVERKGYTLIALSMFWKRGRAKVDVGLARGKKQHDKRATEKDREWQRDKQRLMKVR